MASKHLTLEQQNFVRLSLAGVDEARVVLGDVLHSQIPPEDLVKKIQGMKAILLEGKYKLNPEQLKLCYVPGPVIPDYKTFDITLLYKLIRNLCPSLQPSQGWGKEPRQTAINIGDDIERLRIFRNEMIAHVESSSVPDNVFNSEWTELENIFKRIQGFFKTKGHAKDLEGGLKSIKSTLFGWDDYDRCQVRLMWEHLNERKTAPELTLEGGKRKICGESACFVIKFGDGEMSINWPITWQRIKGNITEKLDTSAERYRGSYSQQLVIANVSKEDEGEYRAAVSREEKGIHFEIPSNTVYLTVTGDVPILEIKNAVSENDSITISYKMSTNDESPDVERAVWSKDGKPLDENAEKYSGGTSAHTHLTIHSPTSTDMGQYSCEVFNAVGSTIKTIDLNSPSASINDKPTAVVGYPVTITATIRSSPTLLSAKWQKRSDGTIGNFTDVDIDDRKYFGSTADREDPKLCIPKTTREDGILYRLVVSNGLGQCESNTVFLKLVDVPSVFVNHETHVSEQSVKLVCTISLYQQSPEVSRVLWTKDGLEIDILGSDGKYTGGSIADPSLTINEVNPNDNGKYQCCASNSVGDKWSESILLEQHAPDDKKESVPDEVKDKIKEQEIDFLLTMSPEHEKYHSGIAQILKVPVELLGMPIEDIKTFVKNYKQGSTKVYCGRGMVVGCFEAGKTTLVRKLKGEDVSIPPDSTRGLEVHTNIFIVDEDETCLTVNKNQTSEQRLQINLETLGSEVVKTPSNAERSNPKPDSELPSTHIPPAKNDAQSLAQTQEKKNDLPFRTLETGKSDNIPSKDGQNSKKPGNDPVKHPKIDQNTEKDVNKTDTILGQKTGSSLSNVTNKPVKTISLLDFAGQDAYYACHHIFLSPRTSYMLVTDMSKELTERPTNAVQMEGLIYSDWTYQDYINHWLGSIHTYSSETAPVILVQSHSDKTEKKENDYFRKVLGGVADTLRVHLSSKKKFAVEKDTDKNIEELKSSMLSVVKGQSHWGESIPTSWVHLEAFLMEIKKDHMVWKMENLWEKLQSESNQPNLRNLSKEDMTTALKMFNDLGLILFTTSSESIILDVEWFVDAFKNIITDEEHAKHDIARYYEDWEKFNENGILSKNLVREIWRESVSFSKYADDLILHMIRLGMIAEMEKGETYYVPCMNKQKYDKDVLHNCVCSSTICFMFEYLPLVIFHRLIATCMTKDGWEIWNGNNVEKTGQTSECVFHTAAMLRDTDDLKMLIGITEKKKHKKTKHPYSIEIQGFVFEDQQMLKQFPQRKLERIREHLKDLTSCFEANRSMTYEIGYRCSITPFSDTPDSHIIPESEKECTSCRKTKGIDDLKSFWMADATSESDTTEIDGKKHNGNLGDDNAAQQSTQHDDKVSSILSDSGLVYLATRLGAEWSLVAVSLGLKQAEIDQIKLDNPYNTHTQIYTALQKWRDRRGDQTDNTLLQQLFGALGTCDRTDLVEEIQQKYDIQEDRYLTESESESEDRPGDEEKKSGDTKLAQAGEDGMKGQMERPFLDEARFTADIHTGYDGLLSVRCVSEERVWTCGNNNTMQLLTVEGQLLSSVQTKSWNEPYDITVTREGDLVYTDPTDRSINLVRDNKIRTLITLQGWEPLNVCCTAANHLLVIMISDDYTQSKVVRYSGSTETQTIQYDVQGRPLYSSGYNPKYISENRNLDICVADWSAKTVVVVNQSGTLRFRYTGHPSNTGQLFVPMGIATDSHSHILIADFRNGRIHILDQDGQFLRYIHNLHEPWGLCVDSRDNLFVAEWSTAKVKRIQYLESQR